MAQHDVKHHVQNLRKDANDTKARELYPAGYVCGTDCPDRLVGLVVKASASRAEDPGFASRWRRDFIFRGRVIPVTSKLALQWLPCQAPGVVSSVMGLVGPVSVYCDWVRWKVWVCNFCLSVAARKIVCADPSLRCTCMLLGH